MEQTFAALRDAIDRIQRVASMPQETPSIEDAAKELDRACALALRRARELGRFDELRIKIQRAQLAAMAKFTKLQMTANPDDFARYFEPARAELFKALGF